MQDGMRQESEDMDDDKRGEVENHCPMHQVNTVHRQYIHQNLVEAHMEDGVTFYSSRASHSTCECGILQDDQSQDSSLWSLIGSGVFFTARAYIVGFPGVKIWGTQGMSIKWST